LSIQTHIPLKYCLGFVPFRDQLDNKNIVVKMGEKITQEIIDQYKGDASSYIVAIRPEVNLAEKINLNIQMVELEEERKLERILKKVDVGEYLFQENDQDQMIYVLLEGEVEIIVGGRVIVELGEKGTFIGEMSSIVDRKRSASVRARTKCAFYCMDGSDMLDLAQYYPVVLSKICKSLANKIAHTSSELSMLKMFHNVSNTRVIGKPRMDNSQVVENVESYKSKTIKYDKGVDLFIEGEMSFDIYILVMGEVRVSIGGEAIVRISAPGTIIGEMSSLRVKPRSATVTTVEPCEFYKIQGLRLLESCKENPQFLIKLAQILANRLAQTNTEFVNLLNTAD